SPTTVTQTTTVAMGTTVTTTRVETSPTTVRETTTRVETSPTTITQTIERPTTVATTRFETTTQKETVVNTVTQIQPTVILQTVTVQGGGLPSRCLIATAAFGSELDPSVQMLRQFRDGFVLQTFSGKTFMDVFNAFYYSWSPSVAEAEYANPGFRTLVKYSIYPLIGVLHVSQAAASPLTSINPELAVLTAGITTSFLLGLVYLSLPALLFRRYVHHTTRFGVKHVGYILTGSLGLFVVALAALDPYMMAFASSAIVLTTMLIGAITPAVFLKRIARG
ncbi:MAG: hypothetical protein N3H84_08645, partial [Candidatus Caldarchaeum sp.]|nr:hypothetical protein [Candidatus Caldarchaeum sp.]